ncbi:PaaI family thioesterase [Candidatus Omnitrophota bacterium]
MPRLELDDDKHCFACGEKNPIGLKLGFLLESESLLTTFTPQKNHQGYKDIVHGGIISLVLDEVMVNLLWKLGKPAVTAELKINLRKPAKIGQKLFFKSSIREENTRMINVCADARDESNDVVAEATAKCVRVQQ